MTRALLLLTLLTSGCGSRTQIVQQPSDEVVVRLRVRDDLNPAPQPEPQPAQPMCAGAGP